MKFDDADLQEFQNLYEGAYGEKLTEAEARRMASALMTIYERFGNARPIQPPKAGSVRRP